MPIEIRMPRLVETMTEGTVVAWRVREGERVTAGDAIAEIEVDKTTVDLEAPNTGTLARIVVPAGSQDVAVGAVLAILEQGNGLAAEAVATVEEEVVRDVVEEPRLMASAPMIAPAYQSGEADASPLARSAALQAGIDLASVRGSGPAGRIVLADVMAAPGQPDRPTGEPSPSASPRPASAAFDEIPHSRVRQVIARRLGESKRTIPHFYLDASCRVDALVRLRAEVRAASGGAVKLSLNDLIVRATAMALREVPEANASWTEAATRRHRGVDLAVAMSTDAGLVAPVVRDADRKELAELAGILRDVVRRAREGRLRPEELEGGTFTVSNLGMHGVDRLYAIINPPQAAILGLGAAGPRPVVVDGSIVVATMMDCTLSADHRVLDGVVGAKFLSAFRRLIEEPAALWPGRPTSPGADAFRSDHGIPA